VALCRGFVVLGAGSGWVLAMFLMEFLDYLDLIGYMYRRPRSLGLV
jgi:hypothetical protein